MKNFRPPFHVDFHSERGEVTIYVTDADGQDVWYADTDTVNQLVEDGFISTHGFAMGRNVRPDVLERSVLDYLREVGVIGNQSDAPRKGSPAYYADLFDKSGMKTRERGVRANNPNRERPSYQVIVSGLGTVCDTHNHAEAVICFNEYVDVVSSPHGRASGESVTLMFDGEILKEYQNEFQSHRQGTRHPNPTQTASGDFAGIGRTGGKIHVGDTVAFQKPSGGLGRGVVIAGDVTPNANAYPGPKPYEYVYVKHDGVFSFFPTASVFPVSRRTNPTQADVDGWVDRYRASVNQRVDGVPERQQYIIKVTTKKDEVGYLRVGKGSKIDSDINSARVYRSGDKANEAATKVANWLKKKHPAKWKAIKSISAEPKK